MSYGVLFYGFGVSVKPMEAEFGWSRSQTSLAFSIASLTNGLSSVWAGRLVDRRGARLLMTAGSIGGAMLVVAWSSVQTLAQLYVVWALIGLAWTATFYEVAFAVVAKWFRRDRANATFLITMVAGFASTVFVPLTTSLFEAHGWRHALRILAGLLAVVTVPLHALVLRRDPASIGANVDGASDAGDNEAVVPERSVPAAIARRTSEFWRMAVAFAVARAMAAAVSAHHVPLLREAGRSAGFTAVVVGSIGPLQVFGRLLFLPVHRRLTLRRITTATFAMFAVGFTTLLLGMRGSPIWVYVVLYGGANGLITLSRAGLVVERFGPAEYGSISGSIGMISALTAAVSPFAAGWARTATGSYDAMLIGLVVLAAIGGVCVAGMGDPRLE